MPLKLKDTVFQVLKKKKVLFLYCPICLILCLSYNDRKGLDHTTQQMKAEERAIQSPQSNWNFHNLTFFENPVFISLKSNMMYNIACCLRKIILFFPKKNFVFCL